MVYEEKHIATATRVIDLITILNTEVPHDATVDVAKQIHCDCLGAGCTHNCLMPYSGCCMQKLNEIDDGGFDNDD